MNLKDLVVLQYSINVCYVQVVDVEEAQRKNPRLRIDLEKKTWSYENWNTGRCMKETYPIGVGRLVDPMFRGGPIGVYDRTDKNHLNNMVHSSINAVEEKRPGEDDL